MKGHTVPWDFLPIQIQALLAIALIVFVVMKTYHDFNLVRRWWPWMSAVTTVLMAPLLMGWLGFGPQGIVAKTMAAELQSLATSLPWLMQVVSALQSISTKGMGLKTAGALCCAGLGFGRVCLVPVYRQLVLMGIVNLSPREAISFKVQLPINDVPQAPPQGQERQPDVQNGQQHNDQRHRHDD